MTDPRTGMAAQAVVTEASPQAIRLIARLGRLITMPRRSFLLTWRFVQEAPAQPCAHQGCDNPAYLQVSDLGRWVWVCPQHLPAHVAPMLPTDHPGDLGTLDTCPVCHSANTEERDFEAHTLRRCSQCGTYWAVVVGEEGETPEERFSDGLRFGEHLQDLANILESQGLPVRGILGPSAWECLRGTTNLSVNKVVTNENGEEVGRVQQQESVQFAGIQLQIDPSMGNALVVLGERPRTGVQQLGGQPSNDTPAPESLPEVGSWWSNETNHIRIEGVGLSDWNNRGRRLVVQGLNHETGSRVEFLLSDFLQGYHLSEEPRLEGNPDLPQPGSTWWEAKIFRKVTVQKVAQVQGQTVVQYGHGLVMALEDFLRGHSKDAPEPPCKVGEVWESKLSASEAPFRIESLLDTAAVIRREGDGSLREIPFYILSTRYKKSSRKTAFERLVEDD